MASLVTDAEVYKWIDKSGTTHYSEKKPMNANSEKMRLHAEPKSLKSPAELLQEEERKRRLAVDKEVALKAPPIEAVEPRRPTSLSGGIDDGSDASRCNLARDVLNGALRHSNGKPIDAYDIRTAENDVRKFCH